MTADKNLPGPWEVVANSWQHTTICDANQMPVCRLDLEDWGVTEDNQYEMERVQSAVARQIAAVPELLAVAVLADQLLTRQKWNGEGDDPECQLLRAARAAIAKAGGAS